MFRFAREAQLQEEMPGSTAVGTRASGFAGPSMVSSSDASCGEPTVRVRGHTSLDWYPQLRASTFARSSLSWGGLCDDPTGTNNYGRQKVTTETKRRIAPT
jgi:hypothetical protein